MPMELAAVEQDRELLRQRWYREGYFRRETVAAALAAAAARSPNTSFRFCSEGGVRETSASELCRDGFRMAGALCGLGVQRGDVFAVALPTSYETAVAYIAALAAGAVLLPIVHTYGPAEFGFMLRQSAARWLVIPDRWRNVDFLERLARAESLPQLRGTLVIGERLPANGVSWKALVEHAPDAFVPVHGDPDAVCLLLYTSGTTSLPKGVKHTHNTLRSEWEIPFFDNDGVFLNPFPAGHIAGFNYLLRPIVCGVPMVLLDRWDPHLAAELIARYRVRQTGGTPYFLLTLAEAAKADGRDLSSLEFYGIGATSVTPDHVRLGDELLCPTGRTYGMTEHSTVTRSGHQMPFEKRAYTDGRIQPGTEVAILSATGEALAAGGEGEILIRGPELFVGYTDPELDREGFAPGGWFRTGDIGRIDAEGYLTITDRLKDIIIRGGENISSREVEDVVARHPAVAEVAAIAMPDRYFGEKVCVFVVARPGAALTLDEVAAHCTASGLARQKTPERLVLVDDLPHTAAGKLRKAELRRRLLEDAPQ